MGFDYAPPKYAQVVAEIKSRIERGEYPPGSLLPSEHQLVGDFGVSRPTIVKALSALRREALVLQHLPQVRLIARRIHDRLPSYVSLDDLISTGIIGLMAAIDNFDPSLNIQLNTYAERKIRGAILDGLR